MTPDQKKMYRVLKNQAILELEQFKTVTAPLVITRILRLQQILCGYIKYDDGRIEDIKGPNPRLVELLSLLEEIDGNVIIWATFRRSIEMIHDALAEKYGVEKVASYYGETLSEDRPEIVSSFQKGKIKYFVGQPRTGGFGLTLTKAKTMIYFNNTYDLEIRLQSEDRAHRIGQDKKVTYIDFVCPKTIDERILKVLKKKKHLAGEITGDNWRELFN
jgi:SNF2 family DNA or RNA helicase